MTSSAGRSVGDSPQEVDRIQLPMAALRHLIRQEVDRRLRQAGIEPVRFLQNGDATGDEVAETVQAYDADSWPAGMVANVALAEQERTERIGLVDEEGEPLPSTLPEIADGSLSTSEAAARLGVNDSRIRQRLGDGSLYGFKFEGSWCLPEWQFEGATIVPHLDEVIAALRPKESPVGVTRWFISPWEDLLTAEGALLSPRRWLLEGRDPDPVVAQASMP